MSGSPSHKNAEAHWLRHNGRSAEVSKRSSGTDWRVFLNGGPCVCTAATLDIAKGMAEEMLGIRREATAPSPELHRIEPPLYPLALDGENARRLVEKEMARRVMAKAESPPSPKPRTYHDALDELRAVLDERAKEYGDALRHNAACPDLLPCDIIDGFIGVKVERIASARKRGERPSRDTYLDLAGYAIHALVERGEG